MKPPPPPGPPDVADLRELVDQWAEFTTDLAKGYSFDLDNWLNDADVRELILEALPMFSSEEMGEHALKLEQAGKAFAGGDPRNFKQVHRGQGHGAQGAQALRTQKVLAGLPHALPARTASSSPF